MTTSTDDAASGDLPSDDAGFLGLVAGDEPGRSSFTVADHLSRLDGRLYGGTAIAVAIASAEQLTGRDALWMTTQFVSTAPAGAHIGVLTEVLAAGRRTNQVRVTGTDGDGRVVFASLGATGRHRDGGLAGTFEERPVVAGPDDAEHRDGPFATMLRHARIEGPVPQLPTGTGFGEAIEFREPAVQHHPDPGPGRLCIWARRRDRVPVTPATVAFIADMVPLSVAAGLGVMARGTSLDNTVRIGRFEPSEWVLVDLRPHLAAGGYGHGAAHVWSESGHLLATAGQSASMVGFDAGTPWTVEG